MPSERTDSELLHHPPTPLLQQIKLCVVCMAPMTPQSQPHDEQQTATPTTDALLCTSCRQRALQPSKHSLDVAVGDVDVDMGDRDGIIDLDEDISTILRPHNSVDEVVYLPSATTTAAPTTTTLTTFRPPSPIPSPSPQPEPSILEVPYRPALSPLPLSSQPQLQSLQLETPPATPPSTSHIPLHPSASTSTLPTAPHTSTSQSQPPTRDPDPDPLLDITRLRVRSHPKDCLYPGATFCGNQKSGRSSYEVSVTIVDVDFRSSFLCGFLSIRGLTEDWPELTTYFDAQIIGPRYGFMTDGWGANEEQDMMHWSKFEAFERVKGDVRGPKMCLRNDAEGGWMGEAGDRGCVFMRWKERFLVPDHRVRNINGASFAGFYYVCVEFNPRARSCKESDGEDGCCESMDCTEDGDCDTATMSGFYFHQNSEPYQQLSLRHVPKESSGVFEFR